MQYLKIGLYKKIILFPSLHLVDINFSRVTSKVNVGEFETSYLDVYKVFEQAAFLLNVFQPCVT